MPEGWAEKTLATLDRAAPIARGRSTTLLTRNRIFLDRTGGTGVISREDAIELRLHRALPARDAACPTTSARPPLPGLRPARLRRAGRHERRQLRPLPGAHRGDPPVGPHPRASASSRCPPGPIIVDDPRIVLPPKQQVYNTIEGVIAHFKLIMEGIKVPRRRGLLLHRGRQRRARLLPRLRRQRPALQARAARARLAHAGGAAAADQGRAARRHRPDLRQHQHDRRRGGAVARSTASSSMADETERPRGTAGRRDAAPAARPRRPPGPPPPKNPGFVTGTIDGREVVVKPGTNVIEAAQERRRSTSRTTATTRGSPSRPTAGCAWWRCRTRPCGKLMPGCQMPVAEGITVKTDTPRVKDQQRATLEFLLLNHPVDCPICDQAGECKLQDYYMELRPAALAPRRPQGAEGRSGSRSGRWSRSTRSAASSARAASAFMREVAKEPAARGGAARQPRAASTTVPGQPLDNHTRATPSTSARWARSPPTTSASAAASGS